MDRQIFTDHLLSSLFTRSLTTFCWKRERFYSSFLIGTVETPSSAFLPSLFLKSLQSLSPFSQTEEELAAMAYGVADLPTGKKGGNLSKRGQIKARIIRMLFKSLVSLASKALGRGGRWSEDSEGNPPLAKPS